MVESKERITLLPLFPRPPYHPHSERTTTATQGRSAAADRRSSPVARILLLSARFLWGFFAWADANLIRPYEKKRRLCDEAMQRGASWGACPHHHRRQAGARVKGKMGKKSAHLSLGACSGVPPKAEGWWWGLLAAYGAFERARDMPSTLGIADSKRVSRGP